VSAAVLSAVPRAAKRRPLAWALQDRPGLLTGAGADAPVPSVLRLVDAQSVVRPACPGCGRVIRLHRPIGGKWLCRNCTAKSRAQPCSRCGAAREAATRDEHGRPLCPECLSTDPANQEDCSRCGRRRPVVVRAPGGPVCPSCRTVPVDTCSICGREAPCETSMATGRPWCRRCHQRWAQCSACGKTRQTYSGSFDQPLCLACTSPDSSSWNICPGCGAEARIRPGRPCPRCALGGRLDELLADSSGGHPPRTASTPRQPGRNRPPGNRAALAGQQQGLHRSPRPRRRPTASVPRGPRRASRQQTAAAPAHDPRRHRGTADPRRAAGPPGDVDVADRRPPARP
jgi:hypothetical protein